ncbi:MAG: AMP-binding protein, partial [Deltaproteobacteria bacterium]|nr:AMP-binding protein [Deltaproteobacteria bacterium]
MMKDAEKTITQIFWARVSQNQKKPLFIYHKDGDFPPFTHKGKLRKMSWNEVGKRVKNVGMGLMALGAQKGDRISIMANTSPEWVIADLGLLSIGGETGSIYPNNLSSQAQYIINDLESRFAFLEGKERR